MPRLRSAPGLLLLCAVVGGPLLGASALPAQQRAERPASLVPLPRKAEKPFAAFSRVILTGRDSLVRAARSQVGARYRLGAMKPGLAFDCSGLVKWLAGLFRVELPRTAAEQALVGLEVPRDTAQLLPGDFLFFGTRRQITHIGVYVGDGKYVHAARPGKGVVESDLAGIRPTYWRGARRLFIDADSVIATLQRVTGG